MSDTPKTDSIEVWSDNVGMGILVVPAREMRQVEKQLTEAQAEIEKFNNLFKNGIDCFMSPCEKHSGENTPPFDEFIKKYGYKCTPRLIEELADALAKLRKLEAKKELNFKEKNMKTPRTDQAAFEANFGGTVLKVVGANFARQLELENRDLRALLDKASQAISCFVDLRGLTAVELKSAHNGICILLDATKMLNEIKAGVGNEEQGE